MLSASHEQTPPSCLSGPEDSFVPKELSTPFSQFKCFSVRGRSYFNRGIRNYSRDSASALYVNQRPETRDLGSVFLCYLISYQLDAELLVVPVVSSASRNIPVVAKPKL